MRKQRRRSAVQLIRALFFLNPKVPASSHLLWQFSPVCVGPGLITQRTVFSCCGSFVKSVNLSSNSVYRVSGKISAVLSVIFVSFFIQYNPDRTRCSGSTERMRVIGEARIKYPIFSGPTNFYVYGSIRYCLLYATVLLIFDPIKCVNT